MCASFMDHRTLSRSRIPTTVPAAPLAPPQGLGLLGLDPHLIGDQYTLWASSGSLFQPGWGTESLNQDDQHFSSPYASPTLTQGDNCPIFTDNRRYFRLLTQNDNSAATALPTVTPVRRYSDPYNPTSKGFDSHRSSSNSEQFVSVCTPESLGHPNSRYSWSFRSPDIQSTYTYSDTSDPCSSPTNFQSPSLTAATFDGVLTDPLLSSSNAGTATAHSDHATFDATQCLSPNQSPSCKRGTFMARKKTRTEQSIVEEQKTFACTRCPYRSPRKANCKAHEKTHNPRPPKARVACSYGNGCPQTFNRKTDMDRHVKNVRILRFITIYVTNGLPGSLEITEHGMSLLRFWIWTRRYSQTVNGP